MSLRKLKIAIDYDDCYTELPEEIGAFIFSLKQSGHEVKIVTFRSGGAELNADIEDVAKQLGVNVIYTNAKQKAHCYDADIWLDDMPYCIPKYTEMKGMIESCEKMGDLE